MIDDEIRAVQDIIAFKANPLRNFFERPRGNISISESDLLADLRRILDFGIGKEGPQEVVRTQAYESLIGWLEKKDRLTDSEKKLADDYHTALSHYDAAFFDRLFPREVTERAINAAELQRGRSRAVPRQPLNREEAIQAFEQEETRKQWFFEQLAQNSSARLYREMVRLEVGEEENITADDLERFRAAAGFGPLPEPN